MLKFFPFNGTVYPYQALVCAKGIFGVKVALKDVWAFIISLLAVRSKIFSNTSANYHLLPHIDLRFKMFISQHRDAAAVDVWRSRHLPDGTLVPPSPCTSSEVYKIVVADVYGNEASELSGSRLFNFLEENIGFPPPHIAPPLTSLGIIDGITSSLQKVSHAPQKFSFHQCPGYLSQETSSGQT